MTMQVVGVGAVSFGTPKGLGRVTGFGIPGPWGDNPAQTIDAGTYEITGTQVMLRETPGGNVVAGADQGLNGQYGQNDNKVVAPPDQVDYAGSASTDDNASANGLKWAFVKVKSGSLAGHTGWVAMKFMGPVGWTAANGGTGPAPQAQPQPGPSPAATTTTAKTNYIPWIIGTVVLAGVVVGGAVMAKKGRRAGVMHRAPAHATEARRRRRRY